MSDFSNYLDDHEAERLAILAEEAGELIQTIGKILRHGYDSYNPDCPSDGDNREQPGASASRNSTEEICMNLGSVQPGMAANAAACVGEAVHEELGLKGEWDVVCRDRHGRVKWRDSIKNLVTNAGESYMLQAGLDNQTQIGTWYVGLTDSSPTVAETDTMASHAGWVEDQNYSEAVRQTWTGGTESGQSIDNSASKATFSINATTTIGGAFLNSVSTKGGTTGTLYAVGAFSGGNKSVASGDTLEVTATFTAGGA
ncbi:MAG: hypothetical protein QNJ14_19525 [Woeseiaceae bacterium]|nr:hypothetical protein [Woeseiaceae bacterium]